MIAEDMSKFLLDHAHGKYDKDLAMADAALSVIGKVEPWALVVKQALDILWAINKDTAPLSVVPDGRGGFVPATNSKVGPDGNFI